MGRKRGGYPFFFAMATDLFSHGHPGMISWETPTVRKATDVKHFVALIEAHVKPSRVPSPQRGLDAPPHHLLHRLNGNMDNTWGLQT